MTPVDSSFLASYIVESDVELPGDGREVLYFPNGSTKGGRGGVAIRVVPDGGKEWYGIFEYGRLSSNGVTGVWTMPRVDQVCVVSRGDGFIVNVSRPQDFSAITARPVLHILTATAVGLLIVADDTGVQAIGKNGLAWESGRVSSDGITDLKLKDGLVVGLGWDSPNQRERPFSVDLTSGRPLAAIKGNA